MLRDPNTLVIVDVEATCWDRKRVPQGQRSEIIEIGVCLLTVTQRQVRDKRGIFVTPIASRVSTFCTDLTGITQAMLDDEGINFAGACAQLEADYATQERLWCSWGNYDRRMFTEQCAWRGVKYPFTAHYCNLKTVYQSFYGKRVGMARALTKLDLELVGTHHRGADDAWNIARIAAHMLEAHGDGWLQPYLEG